MVFTARLTQRGHRIKTMEDLSALYEQAYTEKTLGAISRLPHPTVQKFVVITAAVVGASRRFLAQITRHQNEVKFMSASLQYSDYTGSADFVLPYELAEASPAARERYFQSCRSAAADYEELCRMGLEHDTAGYVLPQGMRNVLIISATPYQWKHMVGQRVCRRNTDETRIVMLLLWAALCEWSPELFRPEVTGPFCQRESCREGKMSCGMAIPGSMGPLDILKADYPMLGKEDGA